MTICKEYKYSQILGKFERHMLMSPLDAFILSFNIFFESILHVGKTKDDEKSPGVCWG